MLGVVALADICVLETLADVIVVIADGDREHFLGLGLLDHESVEEVADLARLEIELPDESECGLMFLISFVVSIFRGGCGSAGLRRCKDRLNIRTSKEFLNLLRQLFERIGRRFFAHFQ